MIQIIFMIFFIDNVVETLLSFCNSFNDDRIVVKNLEFFFISLFYLIIL